MNRRRFFQTTAGAALAPAVAAILPAAPPTAVALPVRKMAATVRVSPELLREFDAGDEAIWEYLVAQIKYSGPGFDTP